MEPPLRKSIKNPPCFVREDFLGYGCDETLFSRSFSFIKHDRSAPDNEINKHDYAISADRGNDRNESDISCPISLRKIISKGKCSDGAVDSGGNRFSLEMIKKRAFFEFIEV